MAFIAVYDACVLYPSPLRDLLIRLAQKGLFRARWTNEILDECFRAIRENRPDLAAERLERTRQLMNGAVRDCLVEGYESLVDSFDLPDPKDRHVLAAAVRCGAQMIVTFNLKHFPDEVLRAYDLEAQHPDDFVINQIHLNAAVVLCTVQEQAQALEKPAMTVENVLDSLRRNGLVQSATEIRALLVS